MTKPHDDIDLIDVKLLRLFDLLYSTRSVSRSAERLGQSQPTVSIWLGRLRRQLHDPLFVRSADGMLPTPRADALVAVAREALDSLRRLSASEPNFDPATAERHFRVAMSDASHVTLLPKLLEHLRKTAPNVRLEAARLDSETAHRLQTGDVDLVLGFTPWLEAGFYQQTLYTQDWVCLVNPRHPRVRKTLSVAAYSAENHISIPAGTGYTLLDTTLEQLAIERRAVLEIPGFLGLPAIISTTELIATLPRHIGETLAAMGGLKVLKCPLPIPSFKVKQHWHARYHFEGGNRWLRAVCAKLFLNSRGTAPSTVGIRPRRG
jgi:DNA-binding transcriptional LysR family regulator